MSKVMKIISFELNNMDLLDEWKKISSMINADLQGVDGFISRESLKGSDNKIYCILKWESKKHQEAYRAILDEKMKDPEMSKSFEKFVNMKTMTSEFLEVL